MQAFLGKPEQKSKRITIRSNGVWAGLFLLQQTLGEEALQQTRKVGCTLHCGVLQRLSNRSTACPISSGQAVRYQ